jgi:hypothetical protein
MVKKSDAERKKAGGPAAQEAITESNIEEVERVTLEKVNKALSALESALAAWNASPDKPADLEPKYSRYMRLHDSLVRWETNLLRSSGREMDFYSRLDRLREFSHICEAYQ